MEKIGCRGSYFWFWSFRLHLALFTWHFWISKSSQSWMQYPPTARNTKRSKDTETRTWYKICQSLAIYYQCYWSCNLGYNIILNQQLILLHAGIGFTLFDELYLSSTKPQPYAVGDGSTAQTGLVVSIMPNSTIRHRLTVKESHQWYDLTVTASASPTTLPSFIRRFMDHLENGKDKRTDPAIGRRIASVI